MKTEAQILQLMDHGDYLAPGVLQSLKEQVDTLNKFRQRYAVPGDFECDDLTCSICFDLPPGNVYLCTECEFLMCDHCQSKLCGGAARRTQCPGCRTTFVYGVNPKRSRRSEKAINGILEKWKKS